MKGFVSILEAFLAIALIYIALTQVQINLPAKYSDTANMDRLHRYSHDIAFSICNNLKIKRDLLNDTMSFNLSSMIPDDIYYKIVVYKNSSNNHILDSAIYSYAKEVANGPYQFFETNISDLPYNVSSVAIGDANNDGKKEVVAGLGNVYNNTRMYENKTGTWVETNISVLYNSINSIAIGDANNDGKQDIIVGGSSTNNELRMYENKTGKWVETNISDLPGSINSVAIGDADNDGLNEIVITGAFTNVTRMYKNTTGKWVETNISDVPTVIGHAVAIGDANNDGKNDVVVGLETSTGGTRMYENKSGGWVETNITDGTSYAVAIGDANNDGKNETVVGFYSNTKDVSMYENKSGTWVETNITTSDWAAYSVVIGDANNDGKNDVVASFDSTLEELRMYENRSGGWIETNVSDLPTRPAGVTIGDADNDGKNEIVIGLPPTTNRIRMYNYRQPYINAPFNVNYSSATSSCLIAGGPNATNYSASSCNYQGSNCLTAIATSDNSRVDLLNGQNFTVTFSPAKNGSIVEFFLEGYHNQSGTSFLYDSAGNQIAAYNFSTSADENHVFDLTDFFPDSNGVYNITVKPSGNASYDYAYLNVSNNIYLPKRIVVQTWNAGG
jgi:hypothetical protein